MAAEWIRVYRTERTRKRVTKSVLFTIALVATIAYIFPLFWMVSTSVKDPADIMRDPPLILPRDVNIDIYKEMFGSPPEGTQIPVDGLRYMKNSLIIGAGTMVLTMLFAVPAAYGLARFRLRGSRAFMMLLLIKRHLWIFVMENQFFSSSFELSQALELNNKVVLFFDRVIYFAVMGYEEEMRKSLKKAG